MLSCHGQSNRPIWSSSIRTPRVSPTELGDLPNVVGITKGGPPARPINHGPGEKFWQLNSADTGFIKACQSPRKSRASLTQGVTACMASNAQQLIWALMERVQGELELQGLQSTPSIERVRIFSSAFGEVIDNLPSYRVLLLAVHKEYDALIARLQAEVNAAVPDKARLRTLKATSLSYVGESMAWFQIEIGDLRKRVKDFEVETTSLKAKVEQYENEKDDLENSTEVSQFMAKEAHNQNMDLIKHMDRMEKQVEMARIVEKEMKGLVYGLELDVKEKGLRIKSVEEQLESQRDEIASMVPRTELGVMKEDCRVLEQKLAELGESFQAKQQDYMGMVKAYTKIAGQGQEMDDSCSKPDARPLTPRPYWLHCKGLVDTNYQHTMGRAEHLQEISENMLARARMLLSAYGLAVAANKSKVFEEHARHALTLPIVVESKFVSSSVDEAPGGEEDSDGRKDSKESKVSTVTAPSGGWTDDDLIPSDLEADTPQIFKHSEKLKNLRFSRRKVSEFMDSLLQKRLMPGPKADAKSFSQFLNENLPDEVLQEDKRLWAINMYAALRRFSAEPEFLAYFLLLKGSISDIVVRDNKNMCAELLKIFMTRFEAADGSRHITKQQFMTEIKDVLPNKTKEMWQDLVAYFPAGVAALPVNFEWMLFDDLYILSPIVYAIRLQHLEEAVGLSSRLAALVLSVGDQRAGTVSYGEIEDAFKEDAEFGLIVPADLARAFDCLAPADSFDRSETTQNIEDVLAVLNQGDIFNTLFFPSLPEGDDPDLAGQDDMP